MIIDDLAEPLENLADLFAVRRRVLRNIVLRQFDQICFRGKDRSHVFDPRHVLADGGGAPLELLCLWMESNPDSDRLVILSQYLPPEQTCHEGGDALLTVNENAFPR